MSIQQGQTMLLISTAGPLPTGATGARFPLTAGSARCIQEADFNRIFDADPAILGCVNKVFRCRQRNCDALRRAASDRQILEWRENPGVERLAKGGWLWLEPRCELSWRAAPRFAYPSLRGDVDFRPVGAENAC